MPTFNSDLDLHKQLYDLSCIPSAVEMVLKFHDLVDVTYYDLQRVWQNKYDGSFSDFNGRTIQGVIFRHQYTMPHGPNFPYVELFSCIDNQLYNGKLVIISLAENYGCHMYLIYEKIGNREYKAFTKDGPLTRHITNTKQRINDMGGTDVLLYDLPAKITSSGY